MNGGDEQRVSAQVFDLEGTLLATAETTVVPGTTVGTKRGDVSDPLLVGTEPVDFGPTRIPTVTWSTISGSPGSSQNSPQDGPVAPPTTVIDEVPSGSALSSLDVHTFFQRIADEHATSGSDHA